MKRRELEKALLQLFRKHDISITKASGAKHDKWLSVGVIMAIIPRHREINELTARAIVRQAERNIQKASQDE
jgi:hypothetical protein